MYKKRVSYLHRTATTTYPCSIPRLGASVGAGRIRLTRSAKVGNFYIFAKKISTMGKKTLFLALTSVIIAVGTLAFIAHQQFYGNAVVQESNLFVSSRIDYKSLCDSLMPKIKHHRAFEVYAKRIDLAQSYKPGHYTLREGMRLYTSTSFPRCRTVAPRHVFKALPYL